MKLASKGSDRRPRKSLLQLGIALALTAAALDTQAAGLGRLNVLSSIGQPLRAEIELTSVSRDETAALTARLASPDTFAQANIDYGSMLAGLRFSVQRRANGNPYVLVTSSQLVNEPFLDVLVELNWGSGRLVREYTLLIDPPDARNAQREVEPGSTVVQARSPSVQRTPVPRRAPAAAPLAAAPALSTGPGAPAGPAGASSGDYVVQNGDTALSIARNNKPDGATLEQMLAALYRDNPQAFSGNINRLLAGATVKLPDASNAQALDGAEARRIVAQSSNFSSYRERIARNATQAPTTRAAGEQASGKLSTRVEDSAAPTAEAKDRLQLSRLDANTKAAAGAGGVRTGAGGPSVEDLAAKDRELQETKSRLALLEKNVADLQQLLALKNQTLADLQKPATSASVASTTTTAPATSVAATAPSAAPSAATPPVIAPVVAAAPPPAPVAAPVAAPAKAAPTAATMPPPVDAQDGFFDSFKDNTLLLVGMLVVIALLVGYGLFMVRRRRKLAGFEDSIFVDNSVLRANSVFGTTGGQSVDTANSGFHSNFVPVAGNLPEQNEVDPVAEADVYIAYGRDAQAEEILKEALRADGSRQAVRLKLLEIYAKRGDAKTFETMASELYAATGGQGEDWKQAAALGATIDPHNPLYTETAAPPPVAASVAPIAVVPARSPSPAPARSGSSIGTGLAAAALGAASGFAASGLNTSNSKTDEDMGIAMAPEFLRTDPLPRADAAAPTPAPSMDLDFDLGFANAGLAPLSTGATAPVVNAPGVPEPVDPEDGNGLDFDVGASTKPLVDPFTASAFGAGDASARTAVNLPAFRARAAQEPIQTRSEADGFSASDIFGSSIVAETEVMPGATPSEIAAAQARTTDFGNAVDSNQFAKTEPMDAFSSINLDLDNGGYESTDVKTDFGTRTDVWQAMATKLDLALAYSDIGDQEGARELLEEVVRSGDPAQADRARQLIGELG